MSPEKVVILFIIFGASYLCAQSERNFRLEFYLSDGRLCKENIVGSVGDGQAIIEFETDSARASISFPAKHEFVRVQTYGKWKVLFPPDQIFPNTGNHLWKVMIGNKKEPDPYDLVFKELYQLKKQGIIDRQQIIASFEKSTENVQRESSTVMREKLDSIINLVQVFQNETQRLETAIMAINKEMQRTTLEMLDSTVIVYFSRVTDYRNEFHLRKTTIFSDAEIPRFINKRILALNTAYETLNKNTTLIIQRIKQYWPKAELHIPTTTFIDDLLNDLHNAKVKNEGNVLLYDIDAYLKGNGKSRKALKRDLDVFIKLLQTETDRYTRRFEQIRTDLIKNQ